MSDVISKIKEIAALKAQIAHLEKSIAADLPDELASLPARHGFASLEDFITALTEAAGEKPTRAAAPRQPVRKLRQAPETPPASPQSANPATLPAPEPAPPPVPQPQPPRQDYSGQPDLTDPAHFSEPPNFQLLENSPDPSRIRQAIDYANRILHTSRVPADIWVEWRKFEKAAVALLKQNAQVPEVALEPIEEVSNHIGFSEPTAQPLT
jgi:hypothetical protein